ncbi:MAG: hypothetical protein ACE5GA_01385 [Candidatus Zixiibacteriota bacterium]
MNSSPSKLAALRRASLHRHIGPIRRLVRSRSLTALFVLFLLLAGSCFYIWQRVQALDLLADVNELQKTNLIYRDALARVNADVAELSRISRIHALAEERFGLRHVDLTRLYAVEFPEEQVGGNGMRELWGALRRSVARLPSAQSNEAAAEELFDTGE